MGDFTDKFLPGANFVTGIIDTFQGILNANRLNELESQGRDQLTNLANETRLGVFNNADDYLGASRAAIDGNYHNQSDNNLAYLRYFTGDKQDTTGQTPTQAFGNIVQNFTPGTSVTANAVRNAANEYRGNVDADVASQRGIVDQTIQTAQGQISQEYEGLKSTLGSEYHNIVADSQANLAALKSRLDSDVADARQRRGEALSNLKNDAANTVLAQSSQFADDMAQAENAIRQKYMGRDLTNPQVKAMMDAELRSVKTSYQNIMSRHSQEAALSYSNLAASIATTQDQSINDLLAKSSSTLQQGNASFDANRTNAFGVLQSGLNSAYNTYTSGTTALTQQKVGFETAALDILSGADANVFTSSLNAIQYDSQVMEGLRGTFNQLEDSRKADEIAQAATYASLVNDAWGMYGAAATNAAGAYINAQLEFVPISTPLGNLTNDLATIRQQQLQAQQAQNQQTLGLLGLGSNLLGAGIGAGGSIAGAQIYANALNNRGTNYLPSGVHVP